MTWGRMDDKFHRNRKVRQLRATRGGMEALGVWAFWWSWCLDDPDLTGVVPLAELSKRDRKCAELLCEVELWSRVSDGFAFKDFHEYNPTKAQRENKKENDKRRITEKRGNCRERLADDSQASRERVASTRVPIPSHPIPSQPRESAAAAAELVEPYPEPTQIAPATARVRGALVRGYRDAFEAHAGSLATDVRAESADDAVRAVLARASVTERDPVELAAGCARAWFALNASRWRGLPRWDWFLRDVGAVLADARPATATEHATETGEQIRWAM